MISTFCRRAICETGITASIVVAAIGSSFIGATAQAAALTLDQTYPTRAIRIVVPFAPGGGTDILARLIGAKLTESWGQPVVIDNRPGGSTVIGTEAVAKAPADGYTLLITTGNFTVNTVLFPKLPFDAIRDFEPISLVASAPNVLVVHPSLPVRNVKQLVALAKSRPGEINYGSSGSGGTGHLAMEMLKQMAGVNLVHIPYKGASPSLTAVLSGEVSVLISNLIPTGPQIKAGRLRALGVTSLTRSAIVTDIPTIAESGLPGFEATAWFGALAPGGTPAAIVQRLTAEFSRVVKVKEVRDNIASQGADPIGNSDREFAAFIRADIEKWKKLFKSTRIVVE
jgi:tripartite-type tricarboxylate transporter receptor subunit TctC